MGVGVEWVGLELIECSKMVRCKLIPVVRRLLMISLSLLNRSRRVRKTSRWKSDVKRRKLILSKPG